MPRGDAVRALVLKWAPYVQRTYGQSPHQWASAMAGTFGEADPANLQRAISMKTYGGMMSALLGQRATDQDVRMSMAKAQTEVAAKALGSPSSDLVFTMVTPCRILDTRNAGGAIAGGTTRHFTSSLADSRPQGGSRRDCGIPSDASAVVLNVIAVSPAAIGYLTFYPYNTTRPFASSLNYKPGDIVANEVVVKQTLGADYDFSVFSDFQTHVVADVTGYFMAPAATALDCITTPARTAIAAANGGEASVFAEACPTGYTSTSTYCHSYYIGVALSGWSDQGACHAKNPTAYDSTIYAQNRCCRVPGR
jgi:hypothetical protein